MSGALAAQVIGLVAAPFVTRLYGPTAYGVLGVFLAITGILVPVSAWALETAVALPKSDRRGAHVVVAALGAVVATSTLVTVVALVGADALVATLRLAGLAPFLPLLPLYVLLGGTHLTLGFWLVRTGRFGRLSYAKVAQSAGTAGTQIGLGLAGAHPGGLILGSLLGQILAVAATATALTRREVGDAARLATAWRWRWAYRTYADFPRWKVPQRLLATSTEALVIVGLSVAFSPAQAGFFALMRRVLALPAELVGESVRKALVPRVAAMAREAPVELLRLLRRSSTMLFAVAIAPAAALIAFGPWLFGLVFGQAWAPSGEYARVVGLMVAVRFVAVPYLTSVPLLRLNRVHLGADAGRFMATAIAFAIGAQQSNVTWALAGFAVAGIASDAIAVVAVQRRLVATARARRDARVAADDGGGG